MMLLTMLIALLTAAAVLVWPRDAPPAVKPGRPTPQASSAPPADRAVADAGRSSRFRRRRDPTGATWVPEVAELAALGLSAGLPARTALTLAAERTPLAPHLAAATPGDGVADLLLAEAGRATALAPLARAWFLAEAGGAPLAAAARSAGEVGRRRREAAQERDTLLAGPRATARLLAILPLIGPMGALAVGVDPVALYRPQPALVAVVVGGAFLLAGVLWSRRMLARAGRPTVLRDPG